ncbi:hypothetical protein [Flavobacterium sp. UBA6031]|nr:hypothetical protein [Flavobacterium sp. UBA6031]
MNKDTESNWKLGMFVIIGLLLSILTIYFIGSSKICLVYNAFNT